MTDDPAAKRDFVYKVTGREPFRLEALSPRPASAPAELWDIRCREVDLRYPPGSVHDITVTAALTRSARPGSLDGRGKKHDLISAILHDLRAGKPAPEVAHLPPDARRQDVAQPAALYWFWRAAPRLGFRIAPEASGEPLFHGEISDASRSSRPVSGPQQEARTGQGCPAGVPSIHAIDIRARVIVTDPDAFAVTLEHGIGTAKAYGYGMIRAQQLSQ
jgi:hypothetical protein